MKKLNIMILVATLILALLLTGCGNMAIGPGNYAFKKIHINTSDFDGCVTLKLWHDNERGVEVNTQEYGALYLSEGTYILIEDKCPICDKH